MPAVTLRLAQGSPCWTSLLTDDLEGARAFYGRLFGWEFSPGPDRPGRYVRARAGGALVAGLGVSPGAPGRPVGWTTYFAVDHADEVSQRVRECGGTVAVGPVQAGRSGRLAIAADLAGAAFGLWQGEELLGWEAAGEPGTPGRTELLTCEPPVAAAFYRAVLADEVRGPAAPDGGPTEAGDGCELVAGGRTVARIRRGEGPAPARWRTCFTVADAARTTALAVRSGGRVVAPPGQPAAGGARRDGAGDTDGGGYRGAGGRVVHLADPRGGLFSVVEAG
ncbi:VOC family protein [Kitasatospora sp. NBC_00240]|uniref:VOC family protein n=1 Tax=Kitasatospora sp. NBC_00240 TaxID=2903567 RepID=UPI0022558113|nr:VOC family protein [Kitasatospora sp. NBC_00240]MCX5210478.1 VOC family protein [Kitasatospora sp. NBC_00240]